MSERDPSQLDAISAIRPFIDTIEDSPDIQIVGGIGTTAISHPGVTISLERKEIIVPADFTLPLIREDGTLRDIDVLVKSADPGRIQEVATLLHDSVGDILENSVFGICNQAAYERHMQHDSLRKLVSQYVSDRYVINEQGDMHKALYPFSMPIDPRTLENWSMIFASTNQSIPVPNPATSIVNYMNRSAGGPRRKDEEKLEKVARHAFAAEPALLEYIVDGPLQSQFELSRLIVSLRNMDPVHFVHPDLPIIPYTNEELVAHEGFIAPDESFTEYVRHRGLATIKAATLHDAESSKAIIFLWRKIFEPLSGAIVKNK